MWDLEKLKEIDRIKSENGKPILIFSFFVFPFSPPRQELTFKLLGRGAWALALSAQGDRLAATSFDGRITTWDTSNPRKILTQYAATGSFGVAVDMVRVGHLQPYDGSDVLQSPDGNLIASGHANGSVYMFNNTTTKIHHSLRGNSPIRRAQQAPS